LPLATPPAPQLIRSVPASGHHGADDRGRHGPQPQYLPLFPADRDGGKGGNTCTRSFRGARLGPGGQRLRGARAYAAPRGLRRAVRWPSCGPRHIVAPEKDHLTYEPPRTYYTTSSGHARAAWALTATHPRAALTATHTRAARPSVLSTSLGHHLQVTCCRRLGACEGSTSARLPSPTAAAPPPTTLAQSYRTCRNPNLK
jgi:hypothetical protein